MIKWYKGKKRWISMILCLIICMQTTIKIQAAAPGYFDNPQTIYNEFKGKIVDISYEKQYAFLKNKMNVYENSSGSKKIASAPKYSGIIVVSKASGYLQVIYEKKKGYGIGWIEKSRYHKEAIAYNGSEKQLIGNGKYWVQNKKTKEGIDITITFSGNQQYKFQTEDKYLKSQDTNWELVREYDHLYIKNVKEDKYLSIDQDGNLVLVKHGDIKNNFQKTDKEAGNETMQWQFIRLQNKNVTPYPAWARKDYGNVSDYSGKMAAAGCGVVAITNAVYALNGQFVDPMLFADFAVKKHYRIIGSGTQDGVFKGAAKEFGEAYGFSYVKTSYSLSEVRDYLQKGYVAISHVPGHYVTIADFNPKTKKYLVLDSHPIKSRPTSSFGNWFKRERVQRGGLTSSAFYIYGTRVRTTEIDRVKNIQFQKELFNFMMLLR